MRSDWMISGSLHAAFLVVGLVSIASSEPTPDLSKFAPVEVFNPNDFSLPTLGQENAPNRKVVNPLADKIGETKGVKQVAPQAADKPEITTNSSAAPAQPEQKPPQKPEQKQPPKPEKTTAERKRDPKQGEKHTKQPAQFKPDQIADLLNKHDPAKPTPQDKPVTQAPKYDANQIAALLDQRDPRRALATGKVLSSDSTLGVPNAPANAQLSQSEIDALRQRLRDCWSPPPGIDNNSNVYVSLRVLFKPDGSLAQMPVIVAGTASPLGPALAESGKRALLMCQPFTMLKPEHYAQWKDITVDFNPHDLSGN